MSENKPHDLSEIQYSGAQSHNEDRVAIIVSRWHENITEVLYQGASAVLVQAGIKDSNILRYDVPGSFELSGAAAMLFKKHPDLDGIITLGCIVQGETRHFEFIAQAVAHGITQVGIQYEKPVILVY